MNNIHKADKNFIFNDLEVNHPVSIPGNAYFTKISIKGKPLYIETPEIYTKQGFVKMNKKMVCDLMFSSYENENLINWFETLETTCYSLVHTKSSEWFQNHLEYEDIASAFSSSLKTYKSGKYQLCRCNVSTDYNTGFPQTKVYDENELPVSYEDIKDNVKIISIVEVRGIKFTSRMFQIEFDIKQVMMIQSESEFDTCLITKSRANTQKITHSKIDSKIGLQLQLNSKNEKNEQDNIDSEGEQGEQGEEDETIEKLTSENEEKELQEPDVNDNISLLVEDTNLTDATDTNEQDTNIIHQIPTMTNNTPGTNKEDNIVLNTEKGENDEDDKELQEPDDVLMNIDTLKEEINHEQDETDNNNNI